MAKKEKAAAEAIARLAEYWFSADLMHEYLHALRDMYGGDLDGLIDDGHWWEFKTYLAHWLSGLFVVVEGFRKLKIKDKRVEQLFNAHLGTLKGIRHETYHFAVLPGQRQKVLPELNWAEELHEAIGDVIREHVGRKARVERMMEIRAKTKPGKKPRKE